MNEREQERAHAYLEAARERGWITLEEVLNLASGSPVDLGEATGLTRQAGIDLVDDDSDGWEQAAVGHPRVRGEGP